MLKQFSSANEVKSLYEYLVLVSLRSVCEMYVVVYVCLFLTDRSDVLLICGWYRVKVDALYNWRVQL